MWDEEPLLYEAAMKACHDLGIPWTDPRTGKTYQPLRKAHVGQRARSKRARRGSTPRPSAKPKRKK